MGLKLLFLFVWVVIGTMLGLWLTKNKKSVLKYYDSLISLLNKLSIEIGFSKKPVKEIMTEFSSGNNTRLNEHICEYVSYIDDKRDNAPLKLKKIFPYDKHLATVTSFFSQLGRSDSSSEIKSIESYKQKFTEIYDVLNAKDKKFGNMYIKLGFLLGLTAGIIML